MVGASAPSNRSYDTFLHSPSGEALLGEHRVSLLSARDSRKRHIVSAALVLVVIAVASVISTSFSLAKSALIADSVESSVSLWPVDDDMVAVMNYTNETCACMFPTTTQCNATEYSGPGHGCLVLPWHCYPGTKACGPPRECLCDAHTIDLESRTIFCGNEDIVVDAHAKLCPTNVQA